MLRNSDKRALPALFEHWPHSLGRDGNFISYPRWDAGSIDLRHALEQPT
jgi:hypothetical protein